eukprot:CAMPEP_0196592410 /NCGR_PEP_ID=MMETSP1081-20130531/72671_1 /TAXON_ID=36882 /ORGANISM="Pyramimonas amylifera, Strain CCMP720" /LENGTH=463 /DNA_ID=CAMNT_0041916101 /DNA_START=48 /DNA_END=1439 /DNA_ORIENTATION=-
MGFGPKNRAPGKGSLCGKANDAPTHSSQQRLPATLEKPMPSQGPQSKRDSLEERSSDAEAILNDQSTDKAPGNSRSTCYPTEKDAGYKDFQPSQEFLCINLMKDDQAIRAFAFSPCSNLLAVGSNSKHLRILGLPSSSEVVGEEADESGEEPSVSPVLLEHPNYHVGSVFCAAWGGEAGDLLATGSNDTNVKVARITWKDDSGRDSTRFSGVKETWQERIVRQGGTLGERGKWSGPPPAVGFVSKPLTFSGHSGTVRDITFCGTSANQGNLLCSGGSGDNTLRVWDVQQHSSLLKLTGHEKQIVSVRFTGSHPSLLVSLSSDGRLFGWDLRTGTHSHSMQVFDFRDCKSSPSSLALNHNLDIAIGYADGTVQLKSLIETTKEAESFTHHNADCRSVNFDPTGSWLLTGSFDSSIGVVDMRTRRLVSLWKEHKDKVIQARFVPHTQGIVSCSADKTVKLWLATN